MMRVLPGAFAVVLFVAPLLVTPGHLVAWIGVGGLLLGAVAIAALWRSVATMAACVFVIEYGVALVIAKGPVHVVGAAVFGLALLFLLQSLDLACRVRGADVAPSVLRSALGRWIGVGAGAMLAATLALPVASTLSLMMPPAVSPILAAVGALATVLMVAVIMRRAGSTR